MVLGKQPSKPISKGTIMKQIILIGLGVAVLMFVMFVGFGERATVETPEVKKSSSYERPVKDGNCYIQSDSSGNKIRVCG